MGHWAKLLAVLAAIVASAFLFGAWEKHGAFSSEVAAWAQAIGTIVAVSTAVWTARAASRLAAKQAADTAFNQTIAICMVFNQVRAVVEEAERVRRKPPGFDPQNVDAILTALHEIPILQVPYGRFALEIVQARRGLLYYKQALGIQLEYYDKPVPLPALVEGQLLTHSADLIDICQRVASSADRVSQALDRGLRQEFG